MRPTAKQPSHPLLEAQAKRFGTALRARRKQLGINMTAASEAAGISRVTWHRLEKGETTVAWGSVLAAAAVLDMAFVIGDDGTAEVETPRSPDPNAWVPLQIRLAEYAGLRGLAWQLREGLEWLSPREAWEIYERNGRHLDTAQLSTHEQALITSLRRLFDRTADHV